MEYSIDDKFDNKVIYCEIVPNGSKQRGISQAARRVYYLFGHR